MPSTRRGPRVVPPRIFPDDERELAFWRDGYVVVDLTDEAGLAPLLEGFAALRPADGFSPDPSLTSQYHCTFVDADHGYRKAVDELSRSFLDPHLPGLLPEYEILTSNIYVKPPGTGRFEVHLNWITVDDPLETTLTVWVPLQDTTVASGTIHVVPGSHKLYPDVATAASVQYFDTFKERLIESDLVPVELRAGQAIVFDDTLLHWSPDNTSDRPRVALQVELVPRGSTTAIWIPDVADDRWFHLYAMDSRFWYTQDKEVFHGEPDLPMIGRVANPNRAVTYEAFQERLAHAAAHRARAFELPPGAGPEPAEAPGA